jgi:phosphoesterase RecJ-like protein
MTSSGWKLDPVAASDALRLLRQSTSVLMPMHQNVDADGLSSPLAIMHALGQVGVKAIPLITDGQDPHQLRFLPGVEHVIIYGQDPLPEYDALCLTDVSDLRRLGDFYKDDPSRVDGSVPIVNIDHHVTNANFGQVNIVEPNAASAAELVTDLLALWGTELTKDIAQCLIAGIYGDTLGLRTENTTARTMRTTADLIDAGASTGPIVDALFRVKPKSSVCLWEQALRNVHWTGPLIWTELTPEHFAKCGAQQSEAEGLVNFLVGTEGSRAAAILYRTDQGWRVSMRSMPGGVDVAALTSRFGGGGHPRAAGVTILGEEADKLAFIEQVAALAAVPGAESAPEATPSPI